MVKCLSTSRRRAWWLGLVFLLAPVAAGALLAQGGDQASQLVQTNAKVRFVHRLTLYDADRNEIKPGGSGVVSIVRTCGKCHTYEASAGGIAGGHHFNAGMDKNSGRPGEPWILADAATGTQLPLSYRSWKGVFHPRDLGMSDWDFTVAFGTYLPGGGVSEPSDAEIAKSPAAARWKISGTLQIDCMTCHYGGGAGTPPDLNERSRQVGKQNLKWAPGRSGAWGRWTPRRRRACRTILIRRSRTQTIRSGRCR